MSGALSHIKVLDLSRILAGPWCTQTLADLGADVIKVERPGVGDDTRAWGPPWLPDGDGQPTTDSSYYASCNRNKRSITCNLASPEGQELVKKLAKDVDVVIENYKLGDLKRYGLDYESLKAVNPRLVYCSITGYGQSGPYADKPGYDFVFQGRGGIMSITGERDDKPGGGPQKVGMALSDISTGMYSAIAICAALLHRERTGEGQYIDMSLLDCTVALGSNQAMSYLLTGAIPKRYGNAHPSVVPYQTFETADGHIIIAVGNDGQFKRYCEVLGLAHLADDDRYRKAAGRIENRDVLIPILEEAMRKFPLAELVEKLEANDVPCGPINNYQQVFEDPQIQHRKRRQETVRSDGAVIPVIASPVQLVSTPPTYRKAPPKLGEHTEEVLGEMLGMSAEDVAALRANKVI